MPHPATPPRSIYLTITATPRRPAQRRCTGLYRRTGSAPGEPLVLLHGMGESHIGWRPVIDALAADYDVIAIDLPGFGRSAGAAAAGAADRGEPGRGRRGAPSTELGRRRLPRRRLLPRRPGRAPPGRLAAGPFGDRDRPRRARHTAGTDRRATSRCWPAAAWRWPWRRPPTS